jgi:hypothetical protein
MFRKKRKPEIIKKIGTTASGRILLNTLNPQKNILQFEG